MLAVPIPAYPNKSQYPVLAAPAVHIHILPATANSCPIRSLAAYPSDRWRWKWYNGSLKYKFHCDMPAPSADDNLHSGQPHKNWMLHRHSRHPAYWKVRRLNTSSPTLRKGCHNPESSPPESKRPAFAVLFAAIQTVWTFRCRPIHLRPIIFRLASAHLVSAVDGAACNAANRSRTAAICPQVIFPSGHPP